MQSKIIFEHPDEDLILMIMNADIGDANENIYVAGTILNHIHNTHDIIPMVSRHQGLQLASRCLISLGFFRDYMKHLNTFHGYPSPEFYMNQGKLAFKREGMIELSSHMEKWTDFLYNSFKTTMTKREVIITPRLSEKTYFDSKVWKGCGRLKRGYDLGDLAKRDFFN